MRRPLVTLALVAAGCGARPAPESAPAAETPAAETPAPTEAEAAIDRAAADYWAELMRVSPTWASFRGDRSRDAELPDFSPEARAASDATLWRIREAAAAVEPAALGDDRRLMRAILVQRLDGHFAERDACRPETWEVDQLYGPQSWLGELPSYHIVDGAQRARDLVARYRGFPALFAQHTANLRAGLAAGRVAARINVERVIEQLDRFAATPLDEDPYLQGPLARAAELEAPPSPDFADALRAAVRDAVRPALADYRAFLAAEILPAARAEPGIAGLPGGAACYAARIALHTDTAREAEALHRLGLAEVERIRGEMAAVAAELGHPDVDAALAALAADPAERLATSEALVEHNRALVDRARAALPRAFGRLPKTPIEVRPIEAFRAPESPAAYYLRAPEDGSAPAYYLINTHAPETRLLYKMPALAWHEAVPGHHLQIALAAEREGLPEFMRSTRSTAFTEGWALYAERLAFELGLYRTPAERMGALTYEIWRAARLVVDTGLHAKGWSREQAIDYLKRHTGHSEGEVVNEIDRYIVWPGQALAYKVGQLEISALRALAEARLGERFDLAVWHDRLLWHGSIPLPVLRAEMAAWLDAQVEKR